MVELLLRGMVSRMRGMFFWAGFCRARAAEGVVLGACRTILARRVGVNLDWIEVRLALVGRRRASGQNVLRALALLLGARGFRGGLNCGRTIVGCGE